MNFRLKGLSAALCLVLVLVLCSCGDTYRPTANPIPRGETPDPQSSRTAITISENPGGVGAMTQINVSGDTVTAVLPTSGGSVHAATTPGTTQTYIANRTSDSLTNFVTFAALTFSSVTISLPPGSAPSFVLPATNTRTYVALTGRNSLGVVDNSRNVFTTEIAAGSAPVALAASGNGAKIYVVNQGSNNVTVVDAVTEAPLATIAVGASPRWAVSNADGSMVFVANEASNSVSVIDTATDAVVATLPTGAGPRHISYDRGTRRAYVANTIGNSVSVIKADTNPPTLLATIALDAAGIAPTSTTPLLDGSRVYTANSGSNTVSVIDAVGLRLSTIRPSITVGTAPVSVAAASDSAKVYVANRDSNNISIIRTSDDTVIATIVAGAPRPVFVFSVP